MTLIPNVQHQISKYQTNGPTTILGTCNLLRKTQYKMKNENKIQRGEKKKKEKQDFAFVLCKKEASLLSSLACVCVCVSQISL